MFAYRLFDLGGCYSNNNQNPSIESVESDLSSSS